VTLFSCWRDQDAGITPWGSGKLVTLFSILAPFHFGPFMFGAKTVWLFLVRLCGITVFGAKIELDLRGGGACLIRVVDILGGASDHGSFICFQILELSFYKFKPIICSDSERGPCGTLISIT